MSLFRVTLFGSLAGGQTQNVLHFAKANGAQTDMLLLAGVFNSNFLDPCRGQQFDAQSFNNIRVKVLSGENWSTVDLTIVKKGTKAATLNYSPLLCKVLKFKGPNQDRHSRGRMYLGGCGGSDMDAGNWNAQTMTAMNTLATTLQNGWAFPNTTNGFQLVISPRVNPTNYVSVVQIVARAMIGSMRTRNLLVGA